MSPVLARWNSLDALSAAAEVLPCCGSEAWAAGLSAGRPYPEEQQVLRASDTVWSGLPQPAWQQAFSSHPRIGERHPGKEASAKSLGWSAQEQATALAPDSASATALAHANVRYEAKFGRTFIVCAMGKTGPDILSLLEARMSNDAVTELREAGEQQRQITQLRLRRWLEDE